VKQDPHENQRRQPAFQTDERVETFLQAMNDAMATARLPQKSVAAADALPIIYIIGAPRSGTTLMSQLLSRHLPVGYIDNIVARFWLRPSVGIRLSDVVLGRERRHTISFSSRHGSTSGAAGPHEFGYFWRHWLKLDRASTHRLSANELASLDTAGLRHALRQEILAEFELPTVFKNVVCGFQAGWLSRVHRPSIFVHVTRSLAATVASILQSRLERYGSYDAWWSLKPSNYSTLAAIADSAAQVAGQVRACRREFDVELSTSGVTTLEVDYDTLCRQPGEVLRRVCECAAALGHAMSPIDVPAPFSPSQGPTLPAELQARVHAALSGASEGRQ
jgi:hypothetical protein